ncbi:MAG TPA: aldehyde dehydrogenase family protein [Candidatus Dormibacteraeota bacterium]
MIDRGVEARLPSGSMLIGGDWVDVTSEGRREHVNPATGQVIASFALAGIAEVEAAVSSARDASSDWRAWDPARRRDVLLRIASLLQEHDEELGVLRTLETGAPLKRRRGRSMAGEYFTYFAGWVDKIEGRTIPVGPNALDYTLPEPYGVVAVLIPWNGPVVSAGMKVAPALAAGNCVVLKPSELGPLAALRFAEICLEAGLPAGVLNVIPGGAIAGDALVRNPGVGKVSFTGGARTGRAVMAAAAANLTPVTLELGGKSAALVFADADLDVAVQIGVMTGVANLSGQGCVLPTRMLIEDTVYEEVERRVTAVARSLVVGDPFDAATQMGPVINATACTRIIETIERATAQGEGRLLAGGRRLGGALAGGYFIPPTVFGGVDNESPLAQNEVFGPVLSLMRFASEGEAVALANGTRYGLGGFVFTADLTRAHRVAAALDAGWIGINGFPPMPANAPFGGVKQSGFGREGGAAGLDEFLRPKNVFVQLPAR